MDNHDEMPQGQTEEQANAADPQQTPDDLALAAVSAAIDAPEIAAEAPAEPTTDEPAAEEDKAADQELEPAAEAEAKDKKASDEFGDLPEAAPQKTRERFGQLKTRFDEVATERDNYKKSAEISGEVVQMIQSTGATPELFGGALEFLRLSNSKNPKDTEQALAILDEQRRELALRLGKEIPGVDALDGFDDLKGKVESLTLDRPEAIELANARRRLAAADQQNNERSQKDKQATEIQNGTRAVDDLGYRLAASDPQYSAKIQALAPTLAVIKRTVAPQHWAQEIEAAYRMVQIQAPTPPAVVPRTSVPAPVRGNSSGGATNKTPGSALEAINAALGM